MVRVAGRARTMLGLLLCLLLTATALAAAPPAVAADDASISGRVTAAGGASVGGVGVDVYRDTGTGTFEYHTWVATDATGDYLVEDLPAGTYRLGFNAYAEDLAPEFFDDATSLATATSVPVAAGASVEDIDVVLGSAAHITGEVSGGGNALRWVSVAVYTDSDSDGNWEFTARDDTDYTGSYDVGGLPAGPVRVYFQTGDQDWFAEWYDDAPSVETADSVVLLPGQTVSGISAVLAATSHITGVVTGPAGAPMLVEAKVYAWVDGAWQWIASDYAYTGAYDVAGLQAGSYRVEFRDPYQNHAPEFYDDAPDIYSSTPVVVGASSTTAGINAVLAPTARISGRLTDTNGTALDSSQVTIYRLQGGNFEWYGYASPDEAGNYQARGLAAGTYRLQFYDWRWDVGEYWNNKGSLATADSIVLTTGQAVEHVDAVLDPSQGSSALKNQAPPVITGTPRVGQTVTASPGLWSQPGVTFTYQWHAGGAPIPGATGQAYNPVAADVGKALKVLVAASRPGWWTGFAQSAPTAAVAPLEVASAKVVANTTRPKIKGVLRVGETVKVTAGSWTPGSVTLKYQWFAGKTKILKATKRKLVIGAKLIGKKLSVRVKASAPGYETLTVRTKRSAEVRR